MRFDYHTRYRQSFALLQSPASWVLYGLLLVALLILPQFLSTYMVVNSAMC